MKTEKKQRRIKRMLPGDPAMLPPETNIASIIRVNHAGEYGARRIYQGQLAVLGKDPELNDLISHMAEQEEVHLDYFEKQIAARHVRPTALHPLWHVAGYALGYVTAKMGKEAAMACTVAVEDVISKHYGAQLEALKSNPDEKPLRDAIAKFKAEEEEHGDIGIKHDAEMAPAYRLLSKAIRGGTKLAIEIAKRV